jgi:hypothetical protein
MRKFATFVAASLLAGTLGLPTPTASAALIEIDLIPGSNSGLVTYDTVTELEWLDLSESHGQAFVEVVNGGYAGLGFRAATLSEVALLYAHAGVFDQTGQSHALNRLAVEFLLGIMGCSGLCDADDAFAQGYAEMEPADPYFAEIAFVQLDPDGTSAAASTIHKPDGYLKSIASFEGGTYMVRNVPEPASWLLQVASMATLGLLQARSRRV